MTRSSGDGETQAVELTDELHALLPPKPAGVLTLLRSRPDAHPMILAHRGLDGVANLHGLRDNIPLREPVVIRWWSTASPPDNPEEQVRWLQDEWRCLDRWVECRCGRPARGPTDAATASAAGIGACRASSSASGCSSVRRRSRSADLDLCE